MNSRMKFTVLCGIVAASASYFSIGQISAQEQKPAGTIEKITYNDHVLPLLKAKCGACHSADSAKGGLIVDTYTAIMAGGASGEVVIAGDTDGSRLYDLIAHKAEPAMPPKEPKLPDEQLALFKKWIDGGALETLDSKA